MTYPPDPNGPYRPPVDPFESPPSADPPGGGYGGAPPPPPPSSPPPSSPQPPMPQPGPEPTYGQQTSPAYGPSGTAAYGPGGGQPPYGPGGPPPYGPGGGQPPYGPGGGPPPYGPGGQPPYGPGGPPPYGPGGGPPPYGPGGGPPRKSRRGLVIVGIALAAALVLCGGVGVAAYLLTRDSDRGGADTATGAADAFLQAVYRDQDPARASELVCSEARDEGALTTKIDEIAGYQQDLNEPRFSWTGLSVVDESDDLAVVETTVTMITADEKTADLSLQISVLDKDPHGWWVCDLETVAAEAGSAPQPDDGPDDGSDDGSDGGSDGDDEENGG